VTALLSAFPPTPTTEDGIDTTALAGLVRRLGVAGVDSIAVLGSTGGYAYLDRDERALAARVAVEHADGVPVLVGVGALRTREVLRHVEDAQAAGASAVLLAPMTYQPLDDDEVFALYAAVDAELSVPLVVYDNPGTTHVVFSDALHARTAALPHVTSVKIPPPPVDPVAARHRVDALRAVLPAHVGLGVSGDAAGARGLRAGCDTWYSAIGGVLPGPLLAITRAAATGDHERAAELSDDLGWLWLLLAEHGSYRVASAVADVLGLTSGQTLPHPVRGLPEHARRALRARLDRL
jgi:4-hydroxy-tetrahydrodipicolinate synthase